ncbi:MAG: site-specific integrase [Chloroflexi bacterium]|nr:site-specific integrase [Chloroflexota bacterium]
MAKKRGNNEGSIYKRKNGSWRALVTVQGQRLTRTFKTKRDGQEWLRKMLDEIDNGLLFESTLITMSEFMEEWLVSIEPAVRFNTFKQYKQVTEQHILPVLGKKRLRDVKPEHIQRLYNQKIRNGSSPRTVQLVHSVIHRALVHAVKLGLIPRNPDDATTPPRPKRKEMQFFDENQVQQLLITAKATNDRFTALYHLAIATGMRQGELLGLKWSDMDWEAGALQVQRQITRKKGGGFAFTPPKTKSGTRRIELGSVTLAVLKEHQQTQFNEMMAVGERWQDHDLVFPSTIGTPMDRDHLRRRYKRLLKKAGLPDIRFHDLRHTAAALMLNNNIPVIVVSRRLGHAQPSITLDVYGHLMPTKQREVASLMDQLLTPIQIQISK